MIPIYRTGVFWCPEFSVFCNPRSCFWSMFNNVWQKEIGTLQTKSGSECFEFSSAQLCPLVMQGIFPSGSCPSKINFWTYLVFLKHIAFGLIYTQPSECASLLLLHRLKKKKAFLDIFSMAFLMEEPEWGSATGREVVAGTESRCMWWQSCI